MSSVDFFFKQSEDTWTQLEMVLKHVLLEYAQVGVGVHRVQVLHGLEIVLSSVRGTLRALSDEC